MSVIRFLVPVFGVVLSLPLAFLASLLIFEAQTVAGRVVGVAALLLVLGGLTLSLSVVNVYRRRRRHLVRLVVFYGLCAVVLLAAGYGVSPEGGNGDDRRLRSEWRDGGGHRRWSPTNLVPEVDQVRLGGWLMPYVDEKITPEEGERLVVALSRMYREMQGDREFQATGSVLDLGYRDMLGLGGRDSGHLFAYVPEVGDGQTVPAVVFLHGRPGNLKAGLWGWKKLAERRNFAVVAPTAGEGSWSGEPGLRVLEGALDYCRERPEIDAERVVLVGADTGAIGCLRGMVAFPDRVNEVALVSALLGVDGLRGAGVAEAAKGRRLLVVHGENDLRMPLAKLQEEVGELRRGGVPVTLQSFREGGHGVIWTRNEDALTAVVDWLRW